MDLDFAVFDVLDRVLALALKDAPIQPRKAHRIDALFLQQLHDALVHQAAVDHLEYFQGLPVGEAAGEAAGVGQKLRRVAQGLGDFIGLAAAPVHNDKFLARLPERSGVLRHRLVVDTFRTAYLDYNHRPTSSPPSYRFFVHIGEMPLHVLLQRIKLRAQKRGQGQLEGVPPELHPFDARKGEDAHRTAALFGVFFPTRSSMMRPSSSPLKRRSPTCGGSKTEPPRARPRRPSARKITAMLKSQLPCPLNSTPASSPNPQLAPGWARAARARFKAPCRVSS